ncbi:MAG: GNAT family N-acetyltransferase [Steroidobacteraceae bacterium]
MRFLSPLTPARLVELDEATELSLVVEHEGVVAAFLLAFREGAAYDSVNYRWFGQRYASFLYIDRVVISAALQGQGVGSALYRHVVAHATAAQVPWVTCEIDIEPPNPVSVRFHQRLGFREVGRQTVPGGKQVSLQAFATALPVAVDPASPGAVRLLALSDAYMQALYPPESNHLESAAALSGPRARFIGIHADGELVACGAVKLMDDDGRYGEIKRVFVLDSHRGLGLSRRIMNSLESLLRREGYPLARLETGIAQPEALGLYRALGYVERSPFGSYAPDPLSVFMEKQLLP